MAQRDDFAASLKRALADRVGHRCSNPDCRALTTGPHEDASKAVNVGVAAHITAAAPGGPRYDATLTVAQRAAAENAIWLCQNCAKLIDSNPARFPVELLRKWKIDAEEEARGRVGKTGTSTTASGPTLNVTVERAIIGGLAIGHEAVANGAVQVSGDLAASLLITRPAEPHPLEGSPPRSPLNQESASSPSSVAPPTLEDLLTRCRSRSLATRHALEPITLPRVARRVIRQHYVPAINDILAGRRARPIIALLGPAGSGKTTILGEIYDEVADLATATVIVRANDLTRDDLRSGQALETAVARLTTGTNQPLRELAEHLRGRGERGIVLFDTLDIVLDGQTIGHLMHWFEGLADAGAVVIMTCRDHEFREYVERGSEPFRRVTSRLHSYTVPPFEDEEVLTAAAAFFDAHRPSSGVDAAMSFARTLLDLSSDKRSLSQIVHSPLLLAMLCELYGERDTVPADLTVSELYARYWAVKVLRTRRSDRTTLGESKQACCYQLATSCFDPNVGLIRDSVDAKVLHASTDDPHVDEAIHDLQSEHVFVGTLSGRIEFFHQTLLEYAIARWLSASEGAETRQRLLDHLREHGSSRWHVRQWFMLRQLLAICDHADYDLFRHSLETGSLSAFRTLVLATLARCDANMEEDLSTLVDVAVTQGEEHLRVLADVLEPTSRTARSAWRLALQMVGRSDTAVATRGAQLLGSLLGSRFILADNLEVALGALPPGKLGTSVSGKLIEALQLASNGSPGTALLDALRVSYPLLSAGGRRSVVRLHATSASNESCARMWGELGKLAASDVPDEQDALDLAARAFSGGKALEAWRAPPPFVEQTEGRIRGRWREVLSRAFGRLAAQQPEWIDLILTDLLDTQKPTSWLDLPEALLEAIRNGAGSAVVRRIESRLEIEEHAGRMRRLTGVLESLAKREDVDVEAVVTIMEKSYLQSPDDFAGAMIVASSRSERAWRHILDHFSALRPHRRTAIIHSLDGFPLERRAHLAARFPPAEGFERARAECELARSIVEGDAEGEGRLVDEIAGRSRTGGREEALASALILRKFACHLNVFPALRLLDVLSSPYPGARAHCVEAFTSRVSGRGDVGETDLTALVGRLSEERIPTVLMCLGELVTEWVKHHPKVPPRVAAHISKSVEHAANDPQAEPGSLREFVRALKTVAQRCPPLDVAGIAAVEALARSPNVERMSDGESLMFDLLAAAGDSDHGLLPGLLHELIVLPRRNARAVLFAFARRNGWSSPLVNDLLKPRDVPEWLRDLITEGQGAQ